MTNFFKKYPIAKFLFIPLLFILAGPLNSYASQEGQAATIITQTAHPLSVIQPMEEKIDIFSDVYYELNDIVQGSRNGSWRELTTLAGAGKGNIKGYFSISQLRRFDQHNYTGNFGAYLSMKNAYLHFETGFGWDISYVYRLQDIIEYAHKLYKGLYWQVGYNYRAYMAGGDAHLIYPCLIYYFGNSYISANYGAAIIEGRGAGKMSSIKCDIAITDRLHWWAGGAYGEWLYDINGLSANEELGYFGFTGFTYNIYKGISVRAGYSYGEEKPKFTKKGFVYGVFAKF